MGLLDRLADGEVSALARLATYVENGDPLGIEAIERLYSQTGRALVIGITGPPGAGKSTLIDALIDAWRTRGKRVGVIAVDPTSPLSGGATLGDRIRVRERSDDPGVFMRSMASRGRKGGLDLPPSAANAQPVAAQEAAAPPPPAQNNPLSWSDPYESSKPTAAKGQKRRFVLDPLLD